MKSYKIATLFILSLFWIGCENNLEINPTDNLPGELAITSEANISAILIGTYDEMGQEDTYGGELQLLVDLLGTTDEVQWGGTFIDPRQAFTKTFLVDNLFVETIWRNSYESINQANLVIDNIEIITSSEEERNRIEGEARFLRALAYFDLVRNYGAPYEPGQSNSQLGVPVRVSGILDYSAALEAPRNTVEEVYAQVISDAQISYNLLPSDNSFFADKYAAQALLARVYFQQGNYGAARDAAHDVLTQSGHVLTSTFDAAFNNDVDSTEDIFTFQKTSQVGAANGNQLVNFYASQENGGRGGDVRILDGYLSLFDDPNNDFRANFFYISPDNDERLTSKYTNEFSNVSVFRIAEMHLIRLESNFRENSILGLDPLDEINLLRERSMATPLIGPLTEDIIFNERQLELAFEGHLIHDYKRTQRSVGTLPYNSDALVFPIPQDEMDTNSLMEQNPGY